jgi:hypothetical protein
VWLLAACGSSTQHLLDVDSSGDSSTPPFTTRAAWELHYSWDCSNQVARGVKAGGAFGYTLFNADDDTLSAQHAQLAKNGAEGAGTIAYTQPGPYYVQVSSPCKWRVQVTSHH